MNIDKSNYEVYLIDYLDGKLTANEVSEVLLFLENNPTIKAEFEGINEVNLVAELTTTFDNSFLIKNNVDHINYLLINQLEGTLSLKENAEITQNLIDTPTLIKEKNLFSSTVNKPDLSIVFPNKKLLTKPTIILAWYKPLLRIAAILLLMGSLGLVLYKSSTTTQKIAIVNMPSTPIKKQIPTALPSTQKTIDKPSENFVVTKNQPKALPNKIVKNSTIYTEKVMPIEATIKTFQADEKLNLKPVYAIANKVTAPTINEEVFDDLRTLAIKQIKQNTFKLIGQNNQNITLIEAINKTTGADLKINKDTTTGRINKFEIAALGIAWSRK